MPAPPPSQAYVPLDELARKPAEDTQPSHPPPGHKHPAQPPAPADAAHGADNSGGILKVLPRAVRGLTRARAVRDALQQGSSVAVRAEMEVEPGQVASCLNHWAVVEGNGGARWVHRGQAPEGMGGNSSSLTKAPGGMGGAMGAGAMGPRVLGPWAIGPWGLGL